MDADLRLLGRCVGDIDGFATVHWGRRSLHRPSQTDFTDLLDLDQVERLLSANARRPTFRLVRDGVTMPPERSTAAVRVGGARLDDVADLARIAMAVDEGATLVLQGLQRTSLTLATFCRSLERATSHPVQANAYLTPAGTSGLAQHTDDHDVLVLQILGAKAWKVDDLGAVETVAGDVLYIPAGTAHSAEAQGVASLHLTVGLLRVTHADVLRRVLDGLTDTLGLGRPLPLGYARPEQERALTAVIDDLTTAAATALQDPELLRPSRVAETESRRARSRRRPVPLGQLRSVLALDDLDGSSVVHRRPDHPACVEAQPTPEGGAVINLVDRRVTVPAAMRPAVEQLLAASQVTVGDLVGLAEVSRLVLVRRLVREGLLVVGPAPPTC